MVLRRKKPDPQKQAEVLAEARRLSAARQDGYRERALALFPHVCGRCGREFSGKDLRELTVHHRDHDHHNNPPDGSNWELLCVYCHDQEHALLEQRGHYTAGPTERPASSSLGHQPFEGLRGLLAPGEDKYTE
jgi:5-methylcytosine-specific restriction endonuclease McrA